MSVNLEDDSVKHAIDQYITAETALQLAELLVRADPDAAVSYGILLAYLGSPPGADVGDELAKLRHMVRDQGVKEVTK